MLKSNWERISKMFPSCFKALLQLLYGWAVGKTKAFSQNILEPSPVVKGLSPEYMLRALFPNLFCSRTPIGFEK
jgi:hypothetical protein